MTITRTASPTPVSTQRSPQRPTGRGLRTYLLLGIVVLALAVVAGWIYISVTSDSAQPVSAAAAAPANPYAEGGSVYSEQVPAAAAATVNPYAEGGSVYSEQVPAAATATVNPYAEGGSVYSEQVPAAASATVNPYAEGGSVYSEQVPAAAATQ
jgi:predicted lipid-binding transport protein (Tim44 family)